MAIWTDSCDMKTAQRSARCLRSLRLRSQGQVNLFTYLWNEESYCTWDERSIRFALSVKKMSLLDYVLAVDSGPLTTSDKEKVLHIGTVGKRRRSS